MTFTFSFFLFTPWYHDCTILLALQWVNLYNGFAKCSGLFPGSSKLCALKHQWSFILLLNEFSIGLSSLTMVWLWSTQSQLSWLNWELEDSFWRRLTHKAGKLVMAVLWLLCQGCGLEVLALLHESYFFMAYWASSEYGNWVKHEHLKRRCGSLWYFDDLSWYFNDLMSPPTQSEVCSDSSRGNIDPTAW